ncbi:unnamed protein product, partial [marine sediment metagenome]
MPIPSRFVGESNAYDIQNNKIYMGDLLWSWDVGLDLSDFTLGGTTIPTIAPDGQIDLFDNIGAGGVSQCGRIINNTMGLFYAVLHFKFTKQAGDNSTSVPFAAQVGLGALVVTGMGFWAGNLTPTASRISYRTTAYGGNLLDTSMGTPVIGQEYTVDLILTPKEYILLVDNVRLHSILNSNIGTAPPNITPFGQLMTANKRIE